MAIGSLKKFHTQTHTGDGVPLNWPGTEEGLPFRGIPPDLKKDEVEDEITHVLDFKSELFRLFDAEEKGRFDAVMDRIVNGWYRQHKRVDRWSESHNGMVVWLEWVEIYGESVTQKHPGLSHGSDEKSPSDTPR